MVEGLDSVEFDGLPLCDRAGLRRAARCSARTSTIEVDAYDEMNIADPGREDRGARSASPAMTASSASSACRRTSSRAPWRSRASSARRA